MTEPGKGNNDDVIGNNKQSTENFFTIMDGIIQ